MYPISKRAIALRILALTTNTFDLATSVEMYSIRDDRGKDFSNSSASISAYAVTPRQCKSSLGARIDLSVKSDSPKYSLNLQTQYSTAT